MNPEQALLDRLAKFALAQIALTFFHLGGIPTQPSNPGYLKK